jgi:hypothetical protein
VFDKWVTFIKKPAMTRLIIDILDEGDKASILKKLDEFRGKHWIRYSRFNAVGLPGSPMTEDDLTELLDEAQSSPSLSVEEFKARLGI